MLRCVCDTLLTLNVVIHVRKVGVIRVILAVTYRMRQRDPLCSVLTFVDCIGTPRGGTTKIDCLAM
jgi:hypothetical protein